ncbi:TetR/AcrR family transcriptional regulator [Nocardioides sp.]|uniref:TetR/AcrR family transcriptional regulator n=1 Tax=Nocardioides sp. TaxID=35761 RepID=UPI0039E6E5E1
MNASRAARGGDNRDRLLRAAVRAFAERGFHGTTTRDIAAAAGLSPAGVYVHHRSKEELLYQISHSGHERTLAMVRDAVARADTPVDQLRGVVGDFARHHAEENTSARVVNYELAALSPEHVAEIRELRREISNELRELVERGVADGSFDCPRPRIAATAVLSLGVDIARWYREDGDLSPDDLAAAYVDIALRVVGAR